MARPRGPNESSSYEAEPTVPPELSQRFEVICTVLGGTRTISDAAKELGIARVNMQTLAHRAKAAILEALHPRPTGPPPRPALQKQLEQLTEQNEKLKAQLRAADDMMAAAGEIIRHLRGMGPSSSRSGSKRAKQPPKPSADEDPEPACSQTGTPAPSQGPLSPESSSTIAQRALHQLETRSSVGTRGARMLGVCRNTLMRWLARIATARPLVKPRGGVRRNGSPEAEAQIRQVVEALHGLPGAASLAKSVSGVSRRRAGQLKHEVLVANERARKERCQRVEITSPGLVRGFDAMHLHDGYAFMAADASVPYRTSTARVQTYDAETVARVLAQDFETHGAPLVLRLDRARCHTAPPVASVLRAYGVLVLQGPAYYAPFYGQHERQNLEHRRWCAWLADHAAVTQYDLDQMKAALNALWLRPTLGWRSAAQCWAERPTIVENRDELRLDVQSRAERLRLRNIQPDLAMRLAIEQALTTRGHLRITPGR